MAFINTSNCPIEGWTIVILAENNQTKWRNHTPLSLSFSHYYDYEFTGRHVFILN